MDIRYDYDYSDDGASPEYVQMEDKLKKFFVYMASGKEYTHENEDIMKWGADFCQEIKSRGLHISDPDSNSKILQEIYCKLWDANNLKTCRKDGKIWGDTMNSANTTLNQWYKLVETEEQKKERREVKEVKQDVSIRYILSRYAKDPLGQSALFDTVEGMKSFLSIYHTLGNFIPVPKGCNLPRGNKGVGKLRDYWDLTLKAIYDYYVCDESSRKYKIYTIEDVVGKDKSEVYKDWLASFCVDNSKGGSWNNFVEKNYMQEFVNQNPDGNYGMPKELWKGHFTGEVLPNGIEQIEQFFVNATCCITARSIRMIERLNFERKAEDGMK